MPYVISTTRTGYYCHHCAPGCAQDAHALVTRHAVATLDEARAYVRDYAPWSNDTPHPFPNLLTDIAESGGTVGPLPDGTVIRVERVGWEDVRTMFDGYPLTETPEGEIAAEMLDAYTAAQEAVR